MKLTVCILCKNKLYAALDASQQSWSGTGTMDGVCQSACGPAAISSPSNTETSVLPRFASNWVPINQTDPFAFGTVICSPIIMSRSPVHAEVTCPPESRAMSEVLNGLSPSERPTWKMARGLSTKRPSVTGNSAVLSSRSSDAAPSEKRAIDSYRARDRGRTGGAPLSVMRASVSTQSALL